MNRIDAVFKASPKTLITYLTAGVPEPAATVSLMHTLVASGADIIELGVPFSDPMADGPVIQDACERALAQGVTLEQVLEMTAHFRREDATTPVVLMGYLNPIEAMGYETFVRSAAQAGVDGVLIVDLPPEESLELAPALKAHGLARILLLAPTSNPDRIKAICQAASGFVYYVSLKGVTGAASLDVDHVAHRLQDIRRVCRLPIGVGFGVKDAASAHQIARIADAVVVGSALVQLTLEYPKADHRLMDAVAVLVRDLRQALDAAASRHTQEVV